MKTNIITNCKMFLCLFILVYADYVNSIIPITRTVLRAFSNPSWKTIHMLQSTSALNFVIVKKFTSYLNLQDVTLIHNNKCS